jgi:LPPG:FO 2-phospho-L-lactate transferase
VTARVIALSGGIGGAKLILGLAQVVEGSDLLVVANTGDDFEHCGFHISPDIDTLLYTLAGLSDTQRGWGLGGETWTFMEGLRREDPEQAWFQLGDKDLKTHRFRTRALAGGATLTEVTAALARRFGVRANIVPMSDDPVRTFVLADSAGGASWLPFQEYFVKHRCEPVIRRIEYRGAAQAALQRQLANTGASGLQAVILGPSNPFLSIDPILAIPGMAAQLRSYGAPVIAVSPIVGGRALKGPTAKIMQELGLSVDVLSVAAHYRGLIDGLVIDEADRQARKAIEAMGIQVAVAATVMVSLEDRARLAQSCLDFAAALAACGSPIEFPPGR